MIQPAELRLLGMQHFSAHYQAAGSMFQYTRLLLYLTSVSIRYNNTIMRTTLDIPEDLLEEARRQLRFKSKTDTVVTALRELVRRQRIEELKQWMGAVELDIDIPQSRRRPKRSRPSNRAK